MADLHYPRSIGSEDAALPSWIQFVVFAREDIKGSSPISTINLYMPEETSQPSTVKWAERELGAAGAGVNVYRQTGGDFGKAVTAMGAAAGATAATNLLQAAASRFSVNYDAAAGVASAALGKTINPYLTAVFEGVGFRDFAFKFKFSPHTESDCQVIDDIVKEFRMAALPDQTMKGALFTYPHEVQIEYKFQGRKHPWLKSFRRSVIEYVDVSYGVGNQWTTFRNGFPTLIQLTLKFKEIQLVLRKDVEEGF